MSGLSRETLGMLLGFIGMSIFAGTLPATRLAVVGLDPLFISFGRAAVGGLLSVALLRVMKCQRPSFAQIRIMALTVLCMVIGFPILMAMALQTVPAAHGSVVLGIMPLTTVAAACVILGDRPSAKFWFFAVLGAVVVVAFALRDGGGHFDIGDLYMFAAAILSSIGYVFSGQLARNMPGWEVISWILVVALPVTAPAALWFFPVHAAAVPMPAWAGFAYVSVFSMFLGFFAWNSGLAMGGISRVSQVQLLQTFVTLAIAAVVNGEHIDPVTILAAAAVVAIVMLGRNARIVAA